MELITQGVGAGDQEALQMLYDNDQLIPCLATAAAFPGFQEVAMPLFAPTYKKKVSEESADEA